MSTSDELPVEPSPDAASESSDHRLTDDYERTDVSVRGVGAFALGIVLGVASALWGSWQLLSYCRADAERHDPLISPLAEFNSKPPAPHLQDQPRQEFQDFVRSQEAKLNTYGWNERKKQTVHIPVSRAIDLILERGQSKAVSGKQRPEEKAATPRKNP